MAPALKFFKKQYQDDKERAMVPLEPAWQIGLYYQCFIDTLVLSRCNSRSDRGD